MGSSIDPVTGVPLVGGGIPDFIDQIPLDSQVFPWDDTVPTAQPSRGPSYPDDVIPTTSLIHAQHSGNPRKVQTLYTDGNHNLRVAIASGASGGGASKSQYAGTFWQVVQQHVAGASGSWDLVASGYTALSGFLYSLRPDPLHVGTSAGQWMHVQIRSVGGGNAIGVQSLPIFDADYVAPYPTWFGEVTFNPALDLVATFGAGGQFEVYISTVGNRGIIGAVSPLGCVI